MTAGQVRLQLELELGCDPIEGRLRIEHDEEIAFTGWLELIAIVRQALGHADGPPPNPD